MRRLNKIFEFQHDESDCGVSCLMMIINWYGGTTSKEYLRQLSGTSIDGTTLLGLIQAAGSNGLYSEAFEATLESLKELKSPTILHVLKENRYEHYVVCFGREDNQFIIADSEEGIRIFPEEDLIQIWKSKILGIHPINPIFSIRGLHGNLAS